MPGAACGTLTFFLLTAVSAAGDEVAGRFAARDCVFEPSHVAAVRAAAPDDETKLIFTTEPLDIGLAYAFDPQQAALEELTLSETPARAGLIVTLRGDIANHFFFCDGTQSSGGASGDELALTEDTPRRVAGTWTRTETNDPAGPGLSWDLRFATDVTDPTAGATDLPPGGGAAGAAYLTYLEDLAEGDVPALRKFVANPYYLAEDAGPEEIALDLELLRADAPTSASVVGGIADDGGALLEVEATLTDGSMQKRRVLLKRTADGWTYGGSADAR